MKRPYKIPADIFERVHEAVLAIANATLAGDDALFARHYEQLREFCELQTAAGRGSGFMWEALADVTEDPVEQLAFYERALVLARQNSEPTQTVLLELGRHYAEAGDWPRATALLTAARDEAVSSGDAGTEGEAASLLLQDPG
jgi:hypothetical protein